MSNPIRALILDSRLTTPDRWAISTVLRTWARGRGTAVEAPPSVVSALESAESAPLPAIGRLQWRHRGAMQPLEASRLNFFTGRRGRQVFKEETRVRFRDVPIRQAAHTNVLLSAERPLDFDFVARLEPPVRLGDLVIDRHPARFACLLSVGPRPEQAGDVEPNVETHASVNRVHWTTGLRELTTLAHFGKVSKGP